MAEASKFGLTTYHMENSAEAERGLSQDGLHLKPRTNASATDVAFEPSTGWQKRKHGKGAKRARAGKR